MMPGAKARVHACSALPTVLCIRGGSGPVASMLEAILLGVGLPAGVACGGSGERGECERLCSGGAARLRGHKTAFGGLCEGRSRALFPSSLLPVGSGGLRPPAQAAPLNAGRAESGRC